MVKCDYLTYDQSQSCAGCTGWRCYAFGRKKKVSDTTVCMEEEEWIECPRYVKAVEPEKIEPIPVVKAKGIGVIGQPKTAVFKDPTRPKPNTLPADCPYLGPIPKGKTACCGIWCYATDGPLRTGTTCHSRPSWQECKRLFEAHRKGVKPVASS